MDETTATKRWQGNDGDETTSTKLEASTHRECARVPSESGHQPTHTHHDAGAFREQREEGGAAVMFPGQVYKTHPLRNDVRWLRSTPETHRSNVQPQVDKREFKSLRLEVTSIGVVKTSSG